VAGALNRVAGHDAYDPSLVEVHVCVLRRKLERHSRRVMRPLRGLGYRYAP
jgi:DNA-binding response OmpR family regulator